MKKILIAEDEEIPLKVLKDRFDSEGWDVTPATDGEAAIKAVDKNKEFDLILLDIVMPKKDGFEVLKHIKSLPEFEEVPIIVLSNLGADDDIKKALSLGANDYFVKTQHPVGEIIEKANAFSVEGHKPKSDESYSKEKEKK